MPIFTMAGATIAGMLFTAGTTAFAIASSIISSALAFGVQLGVGYLSRSKQRDYAAVQGEVQYGSRVPVGALYGTGAVKGHRLYYAARGRGNGHNSEVFVLSNGWCDGLQPEIYFYGEKHTLVPRPTIGNETQHWGIVGFENLVNIRFYDGRPGQLADAKLVADTAALGRPWKSTSTVAGMAYVVIDRAWDADKFGKGVPDFMFVLRGLRLYDPRKDSTVAGGSGAHRIDNSATWQFSRNPAVQRLNYQLGLRGLVSGRCLIGEGKSIGQLDLGSYIAAMNVCDTLKVGKPTYQSAIYVQGTDDHTEVLREWDDAMAGYGLNRRGLSGVIVGAPQIPVLDISADDIPVDRAQEMSRRKSSFELFNMMSGNFTSPESQWSSEGLKPIVVNAHVAADGRRRQTSNDFLQVTDPDIAQYLLNIRYRQQRKGGAVSLPVSRRVGFGVMEGEWVTFEGKAWLVTEWQLDEALRCTLQLAETGADIYDDGDIEPGPIVIPPPAPVNPSLISTVSNFGVAAGLLTGAGGLDVPVLRCTWDPPGDPTITQVRIEYKVDDGTGGGSVLELCKDVTADPESGRYTTTKNVAPDKIYAARATITTVPDRLRTWTPWVTTANPTGRLIADVLANSITSGKIADAAIGANKIMDGAVVELKLAAEAVSSAKIKLAAVTEALVANNAIVTAKLADNAVAQQKVADSAIGTTKIVDDAITSLKVAANAVTSGKIQDSAIVAGKIAANAVTTAAIVADAVMATQIAPNAVTAVKVSDDAITAPKVATNAITAGKIAAGAVTAGTIAAGAVTAGKIAAGTVTASEIAAGTITATEIAAGSINASKLVLTDYSNLVEDPYFSLNSGAWPLGTGVAIETGAPFAHIGDKRLAITTGAPILILGTRTIFVEAGAELSFVAAVRSVSAPSGSLILRLVCYDTDNAFVAVVGAQSWTPADSYLRKQSSVVLPAGTVQVRVQIVCTTDPGAGQWAVGFLGLTRRVGAELIVDGSITAGKIAALAITAGSIAASAVTTATIAAGAVTANEVGANAIIAGKIAAGAVTAGKIAAGAITATEMAAGSVTAIKIAAGTITGDKIAAATIGALQIASDAITTRNLVVTDFTNLVEEPFFRTGNASGAWPVGAGISYVENATFGYIGNWRMSLATGVAASIPGVRTIDIEPDADLRFVVAARGFGSVPGTLSSFVQCLNADGGFVANLAGPTFVAAAAYQRKIAAVTTPAGTAKVRIVFTRSVDPAAGQWLIGFVGLYRMANAELIVDGSVTAGKINVTSLDAISANLGAIQVGAANIANAAITSSKVGRLHVGHLQ